MRTGAARADLQCLRGRTRCAAEPQPTDRSKARRQGRSLLRRLDVVIAVVRVPDRLGDVRVSLRVPLTPITRASGTILSTGDIAAAAAASA